ncbi:MAG: hypothetical protein EXQ70_02800 [Solirubrobacterales bacterium]|nr:hypothetical protein [Solirubrobacterales bacterium]
MGSRERKRTERRKRKRRSSAREQAAPPDAETPQAAEAPPEQGGGSGSLSRGYARAEGKNRAAREALEPLREGERPGAVTVGAVIAGVIAAIFVGSTLVALFTGVEVRGNEQSPVPLALFAAALVAMAWGMWKARYWAVIGFEAMLVLFMLAAAGGLLGAQTVAQVCGSLIMLGLSGTLFYFMIRAMARIQMPERKPG